MDKSKPSRIGALLVYAIMLIAVSAFLAKSISQIVL